MKAPLPYVVVALVCLSLLGEVAEAHAQAPVDPASGATAPPTTDATAAPAPTPPTVTAEALLVFLQGEAARDGSACALSTTYRVGMRLVIACGPSGVWIAQLQTDGSITLVSRNVMEAPVLRLFEGGGRLWAELQGGAALPIDPNAAAIAPPPSVTPTPPAPPLVPGIPQPPAIPPYARPSTIWDGITAERTAGYWEASTMARPFLALGGFGGGLLLGGSFGYRAEAPIRVWAELDPLGLATGGDGAMSPFVLLALASYDTRTFELGLGFGGQTVYLQDGVVDVDNNLVKRGTGLTVSQFARVGHRDGLMLTLRSDIVLFRQEWSVSNILMHGQLPLQGANALWVIANAGGGRSGFALGEIGLRSRLRGEGGSGSLFLTVTVGGTWLAYEEARIDSGPGFSSLSVETISYAGPLVGLGFEWRL